MGNSEQTDRDRRVCVARIGAAHGVRGDVKLWSFTEDPAAVAGFGPLTAKDGRSFEIVSLRPAKEFFVARLKGVADRTAAEKLRNLELYVDRARLPETDEAGEFYHADLVGLIAVDRAGEGLGTVVAVHNFGAGDLIEVKLAARRNTVMLPFNEAVVPEVDVAGGRITLDLPAGMLEDDKPPRDRQG